MSGLALPPNKTGLALPAQSGSSSNGQQQNAVAGPSSGKTTVKGEELDKDGRPVKSLAGVKEITAVQGLVPTLQWVSSVLSAGLPLACCCPLV